MALPTAKQEYAPDIDKPVMHIGAAPVAVRYRTP